LLRWVKDQQNGLKHFLDDIIILLMISSGGQNAECAEGHVQGSPLCAICEYGWYTVSGECQPCGPKRNLQITIGFAVAVVALAFFALLYFWVQPGSDIDDAANTIKEKFGDDGPGAKAFNASISMRNFLSNSVGSVL